MHCQRKHIKCNKRNSLLLIKFAIDIESQVANSSEGHWHRVHYTVRDETQFDRCLTHTFRKNSTALLRERAKKCDVSYYQSIE